MEWYASAPRIKAIVGHYGSGKTEIALNMALGLKKNYEHVCVVDLDIVNPFFRSAEQSRRLEEAGIEALYPTFALSAVDIPALPAQINSIFVRKDLQVVLDIGGDDAGAAALGGYKPRLDECGAQVFYVINPFRPRSATKELVLDMMYKITQSSRRGIDGLIINANLGDDTGADELLYGRSFVEDISRETGIPISAEAGLACALEKIDQKYPRLPITRWLKPEWMEI